MAYFAADSAPTLLACVAIGAVLTMVVQSSSAMLGITIALASSGSVTFQTAVALVLGENIGTTITAILATLGANSSAKRAARAHASFNVVGVLLLLPFFWKYLAFVEYLIGGVADELTANGERPYIAAHIAAAHTLFNVMATLIALPFLKHLERFVVWLTPAPATKETPHLRYLPSKLDLEAPALTLTMAEKEVLNLAEITGRAVEATRKLLLAEKFDPALFEKIVSYEKITDSIQSEITIFLCRAQQARLSSEQSAASHAYIHASDEFESIADYCASLARARARLHEAGQSLTGPALETLSSYTTAVTQNFADMVAALLRGERLDRSHFEKTTLALAEEGNHIRNLHRQRLESGSCAPLAGMAFTDMIVGLRKLKSHTLEVVRALSTVS